jgi:hypothetical protein
MATVQKRVIVCDRHGGEIDEDTEFLHVEVTPGKKKRGRKTREDIDLCEACAKDFLKFMEGSARG